MAEKPPGAKSTQSTIKFGDAVLKITDPENIEPVSADLFTENRHYNGVVCLSFAYIAIDGDGPPEARVNSRIRLTLAGAADLRNALDQILKDVMPGKAKAN
jgi:hypothetical protein